jgi:hypothetical protein
MLLQKCFLKNAFFLVLFLPQYGFYGLLFIATARFGGAKVGTGKKQVHSAVNSDYVSCWHGIWISFDFGCYSAEPVYPDFGFGHRHRCGRLLGFSLHAEFDEHQLGHRPPGREREPHGLREEHRQLANHLEHVIFGLESSRSKQSNHGFVG